MEKEVVKQEAGAITRKLSKAEKLGIVTNVVLMGTLILLPLSVVVFGVTIGTAMIALILGIKETLSFSIAGVVFLLCIFLFIKLIKESIKKQIEEASKQAKEEESKPEKIINIINWVLGLFFIFSLGGALISRNPRYYVFMYSLFLFPIMFFSVLFAIISKVKKNPKIKARYWMKLALSTFKALIFVIIMLLIWYVFNAINLVDKPGEGRGLGVTMNTEMTKE